MRPLRGRKIEFIELILNFELITKLPPTASLSSLLLPCTTPTGGATWPPTYRAPTQTALERPRYCRNYAPVSLAEVATRPRQLKEPPQHPAMCQRRRRPAVPVPHSPSSALPPRRRKPAPSDTHAPINAQAGLLACRNRRRSVQ